MNEIIIAGSTYTFVSGYRDNRFYRTQFNQLCRKVYNFDLENTFQNGYWGNNYIPYSLSHEDKMVSNVSINLIDFYIKGELRHYLQIGTVMTDSEYRNKGLNRAILEIVLDDWRGKCDLIYLFANDSVLNFYPKFGFKAVDEYQHFKMVHSRGRSIQLKKLDMSTEQTRRFVIDRINSKRHISLISMESNANLIMFYLTSILSECVYWLNELDTIIVAEFRDHVVKIHDVFSSSEIDLGEVISSITTQDVKKVVLGFTPQNPVAFDVAPHKQDDVLFILDDKWDTFATVEARFPVLSHA